MKSFFKRFTFIYIQNRDIKKQYFFPLPSGWLSGLIQTKNFADNQISQKLQNTMVLVVFPLSEVTIEANHLRINQIDCRGKYRVIYLSCAVKLRVLTHDRNCSSWENQVQHLEITRDITVDLIINSPFVLPETKVDEK